MHIDSIRLFRVSMPLIAPFRTAFGNDAVIESTLVELCSGSYRGWGEGSPLALPAYSPECATTQFVMAKTFVAPRLLHQEIESGAQLQALLAGIKGNYFAKAAFDLAWWDLQARMQNRPLWQLLGGKGPVATVGSDFGVLDRIDDLLDAIAQANAQGYLRVKLKYRPGWDLPMLERVRQRFPETVIHIDCNSGYTLRDQPMFEALDGFGLAMIEQPLANDDLIDHATLQRHLKTPICLDESVVSLDKARKAIEIGACRWVNIKLGRVGGLTPALAILEHCEARGIPCWVGGMLESAIGQLHNLAFATLSNIAYPCDIFPTDRFYWRDVTPQPLVHGAPSCFTAIDAPGIGAEPEFAYLERITVEHASL